jgi:hypothetical protein
MRNIRKKLQNLMMELDQQTAGLNNFAKSSGGLIKTKADRNSVCSYHHCLQVFGFVISQAVWNLCTTLQQYDAPR